MKIQSGMPKIEKKNKGFQGGADEKSGRFLEIQSIAAMKKSIKNLEGSLKKIIDILRLGVQCFFLLKKLNITANQFYRNCKKTIGNRLWLAQRYDKEGN